jgi:hydrogenase maturation protein HypF
MSLVRIKIIIRGAVQGVGFRPFVYRLAREMNLPGWVSNTQQGVWIELEGPRDHLSNFVYRVEKEKPVHSFIQSLEFSFLDPVGFDTFEIRHSDSSGTANVLVLPDIAVCGECREEIFDPKNRRFMYPFTNCTNCGPRFSIIEALPYDRVNTSMKNFEMCSLCREEYENPEDRRFHAQPNACPECGPGLKLWDRNGKTEQSELYALLLGANEIRKGKIVAVKGLGGFHLMADARNRNAVVQLRERKQREEKPFAVMYPNMEMILQDCWVSPMEMRLLQSSESPIVLLNRNPETGSGLDREVAPGNPYLGAMLPYTPLHHLLMKHLGFPVIATSGNLSDEPICTDEREALERLGNIADMFLIHNRPIVRHVDDSIVRVVMDRPMVLRRARGYAPLPIQVSSEEGPDLLAVGGHLKNVIALKRGPNVFLSQHIGDLETGEALSAFQKVIGDFCQLYDSHSFQIIRDMHPDYLSSKHAEEREAGCTSVQHHYAHVASCMAENELDGSVLGVSWDGTGFGLDGTIWGGEFLLTDETGFRRVASLQSFSLPGGEAAIREPARTALGALFEVLGPEVFDQHELPCIQYFSESELDLLKQMLLKKLNSPFTTSAGRLFDAVASILGLRQRVSYEGQAAMDLEFAAETGGTDAAYEFDVSLTRIHWEPMLRSILRDRNRSISVGTIAAKFHNTLVEMILHTVHEVGEKRIVLTGGCFQNKYLLERAVRHLRSEGFSPYWHQRVPPNDGGLALGQVYAAIRAEKSRIQKEMSKQESTCV